MAILYSFQTQDGQIVERFFSMNECPNEIILDDGRVAKKNYGGKVTMFSKEGSSGSNASKLNAQMRKRNEQAGKRMRQRWKSVKSNSQN